MDGFGIILLSLTRNIKRKCRDTIYSIIYMCFKMSHIQGGLKMTDHLIAKTVIKDKIVVYLSRNKIEFFVKSFMYTLV